MTAKVVPLRAPRNLYQLTCPDCEASAWDLILCDMPDDDGFSVATIACKTPTCSFHFGGMLILGDEDDE